MAIISRGFRGRGRGADTRVPPGQYVTRDFPVLSAGPTPVVPLEEWELRVTTETGESRSWSWADLMAVPAQTVTKDIHCVTRWSKLDTEWRGVPVDALLSELDTSADHAMVGSYGGYTTNLPVEDLLDGRAWVAYEFDGDPLAAEHGGPARMLVPHLYFWKSAKWVRSIDLMDEDSPGFWEGLGYHDYGDPWREQRYQGD